MSEEKNPRVSIASKFGGLLDGLAQLRADVAGLIGNRSKHRASQTPIHIRKAKRRRQGKVARRARRYNRRPAKRPKGRRKP